MAERSFAVAANDEEFMIVKKQRLCFRIRVARNTTATAHSTNSTHVLMMPVKKASTCVCVCVWNRLTTTRLDSQRLDSTRVHGHGASSLALCAVWKAQSPTIVRRLDVRLSGFSRTPKKQEAHRFNCVPSK